MLSRSVCDSAGRVTANTMGVMCRDGMTPEAMDTMRTQLVRLDSELEMLGQVIDFFKLYSVDDRV